MGNEFSIVRDFNAPRKSVWQAWTNPLNVKKWWGPESYTAPYISMDVQVGGRFLYCMRSPEGVDYWSTGTYNEIIDNEKLVYEDAFADEKGNIVSATYYDMPDDYPAETIITVRLRDNGDDKTQLILTHEGIPDSMHDNTILSWNSSFDKLERSLK